MPCPPPKLTDIAIVGGGIAVGCPVASLLAWLTFSSLHKGPALALSLKKQHNILATLYELRADGDERGVSIALAPNAVRVLQHIGVYDDLRTEGFSYEQLQISNAKSQHLGRLWHGSRKHYNYQCLRIHRAAVQRVLLKEAKAQGIPIVFGKQLVGLKEGKESIELTFSDNSTASASFLIGADGVHSTVRNLIMDTKISYSGFMGIIGMHQKRDKLHESVKNTLLPTFIFGKTGFVAVMPSNYDGGEVDFFSTMPYPDHTRKEWEDLGDDKERLHEILVGRFGTGWPEFVMDMTKDYENKGLELYP